MRRRLLLGSALAGDAGAVQTGRPCADDDRVEA